MLDLCHLYYKTITYKNIKYIYDSFSQSVAFDLDTLTELIDASIYIIEIEDVNRELSIEIINLFKNKPNALIYFIVPKKHTLMLFQLMFVLGTQSIITQNQNITKVISKIKKDQEQFIQNSFELLLSKIKIQTQEFFIYKDNNLIYVNPLLLQHFKCNDKESFENNLLRKIDLKELLDNDTEIIIDNFEDVIYTCKSITVEDNKIIYINEKTSSKENLSFISSRVSFIEMLKEKIIDTNISTVPLSLLVINVDRTSKYLKDFGIAELEDLLFELLKYMESIIDNKLIFSQLEKNFYVILFEGMDFKEINIFSKQFNNKVLSYLDKRENKLNVSMSTFALNAIEFSDILTTLHTIENKNLTIDKKNDSYIKTVGDGVHQVDEKELLDDAFKNKLKLKLLNIYNGLIINTFSEILKVTKENVYISFEAMQGVVIDMNKTTVLQSDNFPQDIQADVKQISLSKKIAILEDFKFLKTNANARKYARVTMSINIPIAVHINKTVINGQILDLSIQSIAVRVKSIKKAENIVQKISILVFNIQDADAENGYLQLKLQSKIILVTQIDDDGFYKIICDLDHGSHDLDVLSKYVYTRQKELIMELKKISKLN